MGLVVGVEASRKPRGSPFSLRLDQVLQGRLMASDRVPTRSVRKAGAKSDILTMPGGVQSQNMGSGPLTHH